MNNKLDTIIYWIKLIIALKIDQSDRIDRLTLTKKNFFLFQYDDDRDRMIDFVVLFLFLSDERKIFSK